MSKTTIQNFNPEGFREARESSGFSIKRLAQESMVSQSSIYAWERGGRRPTIESLSIVMAVMGRPVDEVLNVSTKSANIRDLRVVSGMTRGEVAEALGMKVSGWGSIERGEVPMSDDKAAPLAELFGVTVTILNGAASNTVKQWSQGDTQG